MLPWIDTTPLDQRRAFIAAWIIGDDSVANLARRFRISRKTAHKFINRFKLLGDAGLHDLPRAPRSARATAPHIAKMIVDAKRKNPISGPKKIIPTLRDAHPHLHWPAPSTASAILDRACLVKRRKRARRAPPYADPFADVRAPNACWAIDFKGWARAGDGTRIDPLTLIDADSRFLIACEGLPRPTLAYVLPVVERAFQERGLPNAIRSDNGPPFASTGLGGLSAFAVRLVKLGITPERIAPGHPEQNGRLERFHRTLKEAAMSPPARTLADQQRAFDAFRRAQLDALAERPAPHLSGGQQQRVALARALALEPAVLLLDEPLSNLDAKLREDMRRELKSLAQRVNITSLYVTHDQMEALALSDRIAIMRDGVIVQEGRPWDIYTRPNSSYVAQFLGKANLIQGVASPGAQPGETAFECEAGTFRCASADAPPEAATPALLACRPESIALHAAPPPNAENVVEGEIIDLIFLGDVTEIYVAAPGAQLTVRSQRPWPEETRRVFVELPPDACMALPAPAAADPAPPVIPASLCIVIPA